MSKKKFLSVALAFIMCISMTITTSAQDNEQRDKQARYGEREVVTVLKTEYSTVTVTPEGQPAGGTQFPTGGGLYINTSGGTSVSVGLGVSWGVVSTSVSVGYASKSSNVGGILVNAPNTTDHFIAKIDKTYKVEYKKIDHYKYNEYVTTVYVSDATLYSQQPYMVKK